MTRVESGEMSIAMLVLPISLRANEWQPLPAPASRIFPLASRNASCSMAGISSKLRKRVFTGISSSSNNEEKTLRRAALPFWW